MFKIYSGFYLCEKHLLCKRIVKIARGSDLKNKGFCWFEGGNDPSNSLNLKFQNQS